jgi:hypothetical protein
MGTGWDGMGRDDELWNGNGKRDRGEGGNDELPERGGLPEKGNDELPERGMTNFRKGKREVMNDDEK